MKPYSLLRKPGGSSKELDRVAIAFRPSYVSIFLDEMTFDARFAGEP